MRAKPVVFAPPNATFMPKTKTFSLLHLYMLAIFSQRSTFATEGMLGWMTSMIICLRMSRRLVMNLRVRIVIEVRSA